MEGGGGLSGVALNGRRCEAEAPGEGTKANTLTMAQGVEAVHVIQSGLLSTTKIERPWT